MSEEKLFTLVIRLKNFEQPVVLAFRDETKAQEARTKVTASTWNEDKRNIVSHAQTFFAHITDSFGHHASVDTREVSLAMVTDVDQDIQGQMLMQLTGQRANAEFSRKLQADPKLQFERAFAPGNSTPFIPRA